MKPAHSRSRNFIRGLSAGYIAIAFNIAYTVGSVPLALHYLGKEQFGLWALAQQIIGYLMLLDLGVSSAISRFVADHKDNVDAGAYGSLLLTGAIVFAIQGLLIVVLGAAFSILAPTLFATPDYLAGDFAKILIIITSVAGFSVALRSLAAPLWAFQRMDVSYLIGSLSLLTNFAVLWAGFHLGWGVYSFALAGIPGTILSAAIAFTICSKNGYYPSHKNWGKPRWSEFIRVFSFGKDIALMTLGSQLVNASQIIILSRCAGLNVAATFAVGTKFYTLAQQITGRIVDSALPPLTEIFINGDNSRFNLRFHNVIGLTAFLATIGATFLIVLNVPLVTVWTSGLIQWRQIYDVILAGILIFSSLTRCTMSIFIAAGDLRQVKYIYLAEGLAFVALAIPATSLFGLAGVLLASLATHLGINWVLSLKAAAKILRSVSPVVVTSLTSTVIILAITVLHYLSALFLPNRIFFALEVLIAFVFSVSSSWFFVLNSSLRKDFLLKASMIFRNVSA